MISTEYDVTTIYASNEDPEGLEYGFEVKASREASGCIESVAIIDFTEGEMMEMPIEVALLFAESLRGVQDRPLAPAPDSETVVFDSSDVQGLNQDGYQITIERDSRSAIENIVLTDLGEDVEIVCDPIIAYGMAIALEGLDAFPARRLH